MTRAAEVAAALQSRIDAARFDANSPGGWCAAAEFLLRESQPEPNPPTNSESSTEAAVVPPAASSARGSHVCPSCRGTGNIGTGNINTSAVQQCPVCAGTGRRYEPVTNADQIRRDRGRTFVAEPAAPAVGEDEALLNVLDAAASHFIRTQDYELAQGVQAAAVHLRAALADVARLEARPSRYEDLAAIEQLQVQVDHYRTGMTDARAALAAAEQEKEKAVAEEREACALVAQNGRFLSNESMEYKWGMACAAAIRARAGKGEKE